MATFRRDRTAGATYFFTVTTHRRQPMLVEPLAIAALRAAIRAVRVEHPFEIVAWVVLPDHLHAVWTLPPGDMDYPRRWAMIKREVSRIARPLAEMPRTASAIARREAGFWQRRYWEHRIRDDDDLARHVDYIHYNPVKHGLVASVRDWPYSTFHRYVRAGALPDDWGQAPGDGRFGE